MTCVCVCVCVRVSCLTPRECKASRRSYPVTGEGSPIISAHSRPRDVFVSWSCMELVAGQSPLVTSWLRKPERQASRLQGRPRRVFHQDDLCLCACVWHALPHVSARPADAAIQSLAKARPSLLPTQDRGTSLPLAVASREGGAQTSELTERLQQVSWPVVRSESTDPRRQPDGLQSSALKPVVL